MRRLDARQPDFDAALAQLTAWEDSLDADVNATVAEIIAAVRQPAAGAVSDVRLRNLAVLKTSTINGCKY